MNQFLAIVSGALIALTVMLNGQLSAAYGSTFSTAFVHLIGTVAAIALVLVRRQPKAAERRIPFRFYTGGMIGVFTLYANIFTFATLGLSLTVALGLVGQCALSLLIDTLGWFGLPKQRLSLRRLAGLGVILCGIAAMMLFTQGTGDFAILSVSGILLSILGVLAGCSIVFSRMLNAELAERIGVPKSTLANYVTGSALSVVIWLVAGAVLPAFTPPASLGETLMYAGGLLGVVFITLSNIVSLKLSALVMTLLVFISQQGVGLLLDTIASGVFPFGQFVGALLLVAGLLLYQSDKAKNNAPVSPDSYWPAP
jgi:transporter family-2 protein